MPAYLGYPGPNHSIFFQMKKTPKMPRSAALGVRSHTLEKLKIWKEYFGKKCKLREQIINNPEPQPLPMPGFGKSNKISLWRKRPRRLSSFPIMYDHSSANHIVQCLLHARCHSEHFTCSNSLILTTEEETCMQRISNLPMVRARTGPYRAFVQAGRECPYL